MVRIYTKKRSERPDFTEPIILTEGRGGLTVYHAIMQIHKSLLEDFASAFVWGKSCKFSPMKCGLQHQLADEDVLQICKKVTKISTISQQSKNVNADGKPTKDAGKDKDKKGGKK